MGSSSSLFDSFKFEMNKEFDMNDLGLMRYFLGMELNQTHDEIFLFQAKYARGMLKKFGMSEYKLVATLIAHGEIFVFR